MAEEIRADYEQLETIASQFAKQAQAIQQMLQKVQKSMDELENDGWIGRGSDAFFAEMQGEVLPASNRLHDALEEASRVTKEIIQTVQQAEDEACSPFKV
ncbi:MAG TPA: WXG100 family type VII secretion target [Anaerolineae bacterium]|nr:WXG100 family type VII secretion target [Anaerolineae bacterium]HMR66790.1 WXG100 family type VII secretion target [Anaerolineae bacterium]